MPNMGGSIRVIIDILEELDKTNDYGVLIFDNLSSLSRIREDKADDWREYFLPFLIHCRRRGVVWPLC